MATKYRVELLRRTSQRWIENQTFVNRDRAFDRRDTLRKDSLGSVFEDVRVVELVTTERPIEHR